MTDIGNGLEATELHTAPTPTQEVETILPPPGEMNGGDGKKKSAGVGVDGKRRLKPLAQLQRPRFTDA